MPRLDSKQYSSENEIALVFCFANFIIKPKQATETLLKIKLNLKLKAGSIFSLDITPPYNCF
jgi:hypothetical protein